MRASIREDKDLTSKNKEIVNFTKRSNFEVKEDKDSTKKNGKKTLKIKRKETTKRD